MTPGTTGGRWKFRHVRLGRFGKVTLVGVCGGQVGVEAMRGLAWRLSPQSGQGGLPALPVPLPAAPGQASDLARPQQTFSERKQISISAPRKWMLFFHNFYP